MCDVAELKVFYLDALPCVPDRVDLSLHLVQVSFEALLALLIGKIYLFETSRQFFFLSFLGSVGLRKFFGLFRGRCQIFKVQFELFKFAFSILELFEQRGVNKKVALGDFSSPDSTVITFDVVEQVEHRLLEHEKIESRSLDLFVLFFLK